MKKILIFIGAAVVFSFAAYGAVKAISDWFGVKPGEKAAEVTKSLASGAAVATGEKIAEKIKETPDEKLEENAEIMTKKFYPIAKGIIKGQIDAIMKDTERGEIPKKAYDAGKDVTEKIVKPFARGLTDGASGVLEGVDQTLKKAKELGEQNKEWLGSVSRGLEKLHRNLKEKAPALSPFPPLPLPQPPAGSQGGSGESPAK